mgnify:CR=1 FL=1
MKMIIQTRYQDQTQWETSGKLAELQRKAKSGELAMSVWLLCWQIAFYGENYVNQLPETNNVRIALELLA